MPNLKGAALTQWIIGIVLVVAVAVAFLAVYYMDKRGGRGSGLGKEFDYDISKYRKTDPSLILYKEVGSPIATGFDQARALAVGPDNILYVAGDRAVRVFDPDSGEMKSVIKTGGTPTCITVNGDGLIYVGVKDHVEVYDHKGRSKGVWDCPDAECWFTSIAVSKETAFVADYGKRTIHKYALSGELVESIGEFIIPSPFFDVDISEEGLLYAANTGRHRIETYSDEGDLVTWWGETSNTDIKGFSGCCNPVNIALFPGDKGFVVSEKGLTRVKVYDMLGAFKGVAAGAELFVSHDRACSSPDFDSIYSGLDLAVDSKGRVFVLDCALSEVRVFTLGDK